MAAKLVRRPWRHRVTHLESTDPRLCKAPGKGTAKRGKCGLDHPRVLLCALITAIFATPIYASSRLSTDVVYMKNGDKITCEIRSLSQGQLTVKQEYASSTVVLDWRKVDHVQSKQRFVVVDTKGHAFNGAISESSASHIVSIDEA